MQLIPVLDLRAGAVVRAVRGERASYQPVVSRLVAGSEPVAVAHALATACGADELYLADLDALQGGRAQSAVLQALLRADERRRWWVDAGFRDLDDARRLRDALGAAGERLMPVFASESLRDAGVLDALAREPGWPCPLSLDRRDGRAMDPEIGRAHV